MDRVIVKRVTYVCETCGYRQPFDPYEPGVMSRVFPEYPGIAEGDCPACYSGKNPQGQRLPSKLSRLEGADLSDLMTTVTVASDADLAETTVEVVDSHGAPVMQQVDEKYALKVNPDTGEVTSELTPVLAPEVRPLTDDELAALKEQRDRSLDALSDVAVQEVDDERT